MKYDLHNHTTFSDGKLTPEDLIKKKINLGLNLIAITDHYEDIKDINRYFTEIKALSEKYKNEIVVIAGIEKEFMGYHIVVFGTEYIIEKHKSFHDYMEKFPASNSLKHCLILAHPETIINEVFEIILKQMSAIEITIGGFLLNDNSFLNSYIEMYNLKKFAVSDMHEIKPGWDTYTEIEGINVKNEKELIDFITSKEKPRYKYNLWSE
jgi:histidinol phosphatase-like PHP family hydrolase